MKKQYSCLSCLAITAMALLVFGPYVYADDVSKVNDPFQAIHADRAKMEAQLGLDPQKDIYPHATGYYDDLVDHYEHDQIKFDENNP